jgi:hypothetical protein
MIDPRHVWGVSLPASALPIAMGGLTALGLLYSRNLDIWLLCLASLWITILCIGGRKSHPVFWWFIILSWSRVFADVMLADVNDQDLSDLSDWRRAAIFFSLISLFFIACGIRFGFGAGRSVEPNYLQVRSPTLRQMFGVYLCSLPIFTLLAIAARISQSTEQIFGSFLALKAVLVYCIAASVYQTGRGYTVLMLFLVGEVVLGFTGFFAAFKEPIIIACVAALSSYPGDGLGRAINKRFVLASLCAGAIIWLSLVWITVRPEYREWLNEGTGAQVVLKTLPERLAWLSDELFSEKLMHGNIDYRRASESLLSRIAYTYYYSLVLERRDAGLIPPDEARWLGAIKRIMMPRLFFPNKSEVNDSETTERLTGISIDQNTSVGVGYIAETHLDFGFPLMLVPLFAIGFAMGRVARAFANMNAPRIICDGFICGAIVGAFAYESAIDKALPGFVLSSGALAICARYVYPVFARKFGRKVQSGIQSEA